MKARDNKIWFDTEFIDDGKTIDLISIGLVREDGATYYAEDASCDHTKACVWVKNNVLTHLTGPSLPRWKIAQDILEFAGEEPEFWAYYAAYDWVVLCQLYGRMIDLPRGWPMFCMDVKQTAYLNREFVLPRQTSTEHNALHDAIWTRNAWLHLRNKKIL